METKSLEDFCDKLIGIKDKSERMDKFGRDYAELLDFIKASCWIQTNSFRESEVADILGNAMSLLEEKVGRKFFNAQSISIERNDKGDVYISEKTEPDIRYFVCNSRDAFPLKECTEPFY